MTTKAKKAAGKLAAKTPKKKPTKEQVREMVLADQASARAAAAAARESQTTPPTKSAKKAKTEKTTAPAGTITVVAKENPHAEGSKRAKWFQQLKTGMPVEEATAAGVRSTYLHRMVRSGVLKIG